MNQTSALIIGILGILLTALLPIALGIIIQCLSRKPITPLLNALIALIFVTILFWIFDQPILRIMDSTALSLTGSFLTVWLLITTGSRIAFGLKNRTTASKTMHEK